MSINPAAQRPPYGYKAAIVEKSMGKWRVATEVDRGALIDSFRTFPTHNEALSYAVAQLDPTKKEQNR